MLANYTVVMHTIQISPHRLLTQNISNSNIENYKWAESDIDIKIFLPLYSPVYSIEISRKSNHAAQNEHHQAEEPDPACKVVFH